MGQGGCMMVLARRRVVVVCETGPGPVVDALDGPLLRSKDEEPKLVVVGEADVLDSCDAVRFHLKPEVKI